MSVQLLPVLSSDKDELDLPIYVIEQSGTLTQMVSDLGIDLTSTQKMERIELEKCDTYSLKKTIEFCKFYDSHPQLPDDSTDDLKKIREESVKTFNARFVEDVQEYNFVLILVADFLEIPKMFTLLCDDVADSMRGKTVEELREKFDIVDDFTAEDHKFVSSLK
uniref:Skp1-related protein n=1 Tax=Rhabditophanes sp. KR3021 TaxID=114890 RepID=A0AC35TPV5_9BILA